MIAIAETASLSLQFEGGSPAEPPPAPQIAGLTIQYAGQSQSIKIINGRYSASTTHTYQIRASQIGAYTIPPITAIVEGQRISSAPLTLTVVQADPRQAEIAFLTLNFPKRQFYVGEATTADMYVHTRGGTIRTVPSLQGEGATFGTNVPAGPRDQVATNNAVYWRLGWRVPVTFVKSGQFQFTAGDCLLEVQFRRPRTPDGFGFDIFSDIDNRQFQLTSEPNLVEVRPLPARDVPSGFSGAVGRYTLNAAVSTNKVAAGDPITLTVRLSGIGNLDSLRWAAPADWRGFKAYDPASRIELSDPLGLTGTHIFEQVLVPESPQTRAIPELHFSFFDPIREAYQTASHPGFALEVMPAAAAPAQPTFSGPTTPESAPTPVDIVHIKSRLGTLASVAPPLVTRSWFLALQLLPLGAWLAALAWQRRALRLAADPRHRRRREVRRKVRAGLTALRHHAEARDSQGFYSELFRLLQEQLGERLGLQAASLTADIVDRQLRAAGADDALVRDVERLFRLCDQARYAAQSNPAALDDIIPTASAVVGGLQELELYDDH